jgi:uncharacterized protein (TIGR02145 family)
VFKIKTMKFLTTILFLFVFEFSQGQVPGTAIINRALFAKFNLSITINSSSSITFNIDAVGGAGQISEVGVVYGIAKGLTISSTIYKPSASPATFGTRIATISYSGPTSTTLTVLSTSTVNSQGTNTFFVAPYYAKLYAIKNNVTYYGPEIEFLPNWPTVTEPGTGKSWSAANLGALSIATSSTDSDSYGFLYQWGRGTDGHQFRNSSIPTTTNQSSSDDPGNGAFIKAGSGTNGNWRSSANNSLWAGASSTNNPCPSGWRIPTKLEWYSFMRNNSGNNTLRLSIGMAIGSVLKLPASQARSRIDATVTAGNNHMYWMMNWSESLGGNGSWSINFYDGGWGEGSGTEAYGAAVRCIQN